MIGVKTSIDFELGLGSVCDGFTENKQDLSASLSQLNLFENLGPEDVVWANR